MLITSFVICAILLLIQTPFGVLWFLGVMPNSVYTLSPVAVLSIVAALFGLYTLAGLVFLFQEPFDAVIRTFVRRAGKSQTTKDHASAIERHWKSITLSHIGKTYVGLIIAFAYIIYYYAQFHSRGTPNFAGDTDIYIFYKTDMFVNLLVYWMEWRSFIGMWTAFSAALNHIKALNPNKR